MEQPAPIKNDYPAVWSLVIRDMATRDNMGRSRYGVPLQCHNGRDALKDLTEELLDGIVYLRQFQEEMKCLGIDLKSLHARAVEHQRLGMDGTAETATSLRLILEKNPALIAE